MPKVTIIDLGSNNIFFFKWIFEPSYFIRYLALQTVASWRGPIEITAAQLPSHISQPTANIWVGDLFKGVRPVLQGFVVTMHDGACKTGSQNLRPLGSGIWHTVCGIWRTVRTRPKCNVITNPDRSVLILIITWHVSLQSVYVHILNLKGKYGTQIESCLTCYSQIYVMWCP